MIIIQYKDKTIEQFNPPLNLTIEEDNLIIEYYKDRKFPTIKGYTFDKIPLTSINSIISK